MVNQGGVSVRVGDIGFDAETYSHTFYKEHDINGVSYIKVATGEQFVVIVDISPDFDFMGCPEVQICCKVDDEHAMWALSADELARLRAQHNMRRINFFDTERFVDGRWMRCPLAFDELEIDDEIEWSPEEVLSDGINLGRIVVTIRRGATEPWGPVLMMPHECAGNLKLTSRTVMEDFHQTHALKAEPFDGCLQPWQDWHFEPARGRAGRPMKLEIRFRSQEVLELLGLAPDALIDVKDEAEDRKDPTIRSERAVVMPDLEVEAVVKIEDGEMDAPHPPVKSKSKAKSSNPRRKTLSSKIAKQEHEQEHDVVVSGTKRKRKATTKSTSTSKKLKHEEPSVDSELEQEGPSSRTRVKARSKARPKAKVGKAAATATASEFLAFYILAVSEDEDDADEDEVQYLRSQPVRRVVGRYVID